MKNKNSSKLFAVAVSTLACAGMAKASTDYGPAIWRSACSGHWNTTGNGHKFLVVHDMEGYYAYEVSSGGGLRSCSTTVSVHYAVNGKQDTSTDYAAGEVTQFVRESYYAWHARCWNGSSAGVEHEGFRSNPAWYTDAMYNSSSALYRHLADHYGIAKDRNHIVGHDAKSSSAWVSWANANLGINASCNTHDDPGPYWDWSRFMSLINPVTGTIVDNSSAGFSCSANWATASSSTDKYGADYRYHSTQAVSDQATWTASVSAGSHTVYVWYPEGSNRSTTAAYAISTSAGTSTVTVNQQITGGQWVNQGAFTMNAGANTIKLSCWTGTGFVVVADAVKWQ